MQARTRQGIVPFIRINRNKVYETHAAYMRNKWDSLARFTFVRPRQTENVNEDITSLHVYNVLGICTITCLNTCSKPQSWN